jgi:hypothetical protein
MKKALCCFALACSLSAAACAEDHIDISPARSADIGSAADAPGQAKAIIRTYWKSWQDRDFDRMRSTLADNVRVRGGGGFQLDSADALVAASKGGHPWKGVVMVTETYHAAGGTILYEGTDTVTAEHFRVAEVVTLAYGKIQDLVVVLSPLPKEPITSRNLPPAAIDQLIFVPFFPDQPQGPAFVPLWGDVNKGASGFLLRVPAQFPGFPHTHTAGYRTIVLRGVVRNGPEIELAPDLPAGSFFSQAAGEVHTTSCRSAQPCLSLVMFDGPFDVKPVQGR